MAYSYTAFTGNGSTTQYAVSFPYIRREHVAVTVAGVPSTFTWVNNSLIQMDAAPAAAAAVRVYRTTPISAPLVDFADGSTLVAADLDTNSRQSIYIQQELDDAQTDNLPNVIPNGNKGDITTSVGGTVWAINGGAVLEAKIGTGAVTETKIGTGAVTSGKIADGTIVDADVNASAGIVASKLAFTQSGTGATARTIDSKLKDTVSVKDFGAVGDGIADDTAAIQVAVTAAISLRKAIFFPSGTYLVTDTINLPEFTQIYGEHKHKTARDSGNDPVSSTKINFNPATAKPLFVCSGTITSTGYRRGYRIEGLFIFGNSTTSSGNSTIAINVDSVTDSTFANLAIQGFRTGIRTNFTIDNKFDYVRVINCYEQCVLYAGGTATTDVWHQCYISNAPIGVKATGTSVAIRFVNCIFETIANYGVELDKENYGWMFDNIYVEDVPSAGAANTSGAMFRVGFSGTTLSEETQLTVIGGEIGGPNGAAFGSAFDIGLVNGVVISAPSISRYATSIKTDATTRINSVLSCGFSNIGVSAIYNDATKISGIIPISLSNVSPYNQQFARLNRVISPQIRAADNGTSGDLELRGANVFLGNSAGGGYVVPYLDNSTPIGFPGQRWSVVYAATGTINTSDGRDKQDVSNLDAAEQQVALALKGLIKKFRFKDAVESKGNDARIHIGVIVQDVIAAFEAEGLNPMRYGIVCYDKWDARQDEDGNETMPAGNRYGIRYEELLAFIISTL